MAFILKNFLPLEVIEFDTEQEKLLQVLRSNSQIGWSGPMGQKLKDAADMESALAKHVFKDP